MKTRWLAAGAAGLIAAALAFPISANAAPEAGAAGGSKPATGAPGKGGAAKGGAAKPGAGSGQRGGGRGGRFFKMVLEKLDLKPDQKAKVEKLQAETKSQMDKLRSGPGTDDEKRAKGREAMKQVRDKLNAILTKDQQAKLKTMMDEARKKREAERGAGGPGATGAPGKPGAGAPKPGKGTGTPKPPAS
jgi:Spy/CpxP family protein refolding chaperone